LFETKFYENSEISSLLAPRALPVDKMNLELRRIWPYSF